MQHYPLRKILKAVLRYIAIFIALLVIYVIAGLTLYYIPVNRNANYKAPNDITIYLKSNGVHTDVVVPVRNDITDWTQFVKYEHTDTKDSTYQYVGMGWGDKGFYLQTPEWKDLKVSVALKAALHLSSSAIHATFYHSIDTTQPKCVALHISGDNYKLLSDYIQKSFDFDANKQTIHIPSINDGYGNSDAFYEAKGSYNLFYTCNTWTNNALKASHQKAAWWTLLDKGIFYHYK